MGRTYATATIIGDNDSREYEFLVDTGSSLIGLPQAEIDGMGLTPVPNGTLEVLTATGIVERQAYWALGTIDGRGFGAMITEAPVALIGYDLLENLRYKVNPVTGSLERLGPDELGPPYQLLQSGPATACAPTPPRTSRTSPSSAATATSPASLSKRTGTSAATSSNAC